MKKVTKILRRLWLRVRIARVRMLRWWRVQDRKYRWKWRAANGAVALLMIVVACLPAAQFVLDRDRYGLDTTVLKMIGHTDPSLAKQLTYDTQAKQYVFNRDAIETGMNAGLPAKLQKAAAGAADKSNAKTYSLEVPEDFNKGVTYHDTNSQLSFSMIPQFKGMSGKIEQGHIVFPLHDGSRAVYTLKNNGLKEDIIVPEVRENTLTYTYELKLPSTLEIRALPDGSGAVGVYSANPALFGDISYGNDNDRVQVEKAREMNTKDTLVFGLPTPVTLDANGQEVGSTRFELRSNILSVIATDLEGIKGPIAIDPSVAVISTSDFRTQGNNEGMIDFNTSGQVTRDGLTGGTLAAWSSTSSLSYEFEHARSVAYNGYLYVVGGTKRTPPTNYSTVSYAAINSDGTLGSWNTTTSLPHVWQDGGVVTYNGYLYVLNGINTSTNLDSVYYTSINSNGTLGSWSTATTVPAALRSSTAVAYGGYLYVLSGTTGSNDLNANANVYYAPVNANGSIGVWSTTTSLTFARNHSEAVAYNGYMYILGGATTAPAYTNVVQYAKINNDGTLGSWNSTNNFTTARYGMFVGVYNGYIYLTGGTNGSARTDTQYAQINANGSLGTWATSPNNLATGRIYPTGAIYNGYVYVGGGYDNSVNMSDMQYAKLDTAGKPVAFATLTNNFSTARSLVCSVAYNGFLYAIGGSTSDNGNNNVTTVQYTSLNNSTGNNGSWSSGTALPAGRGSAACTAYGGYLYVMAGYTGSSTQSSAVLYIGVNSNGSLAASWTTSANSFSSAFGGKPVAFTYGTSNGTYLYVLGGCATDGTSACSDVRYTAINPSTGDVGTWSTSGNSMTNQYRYRGYAQVGKYLYAFGGYGSSAAQSAVEYTSINSDGTINAWASTTSLGTAVGYTGGTAVNGCIYSIGGKNTALASLANVQYACPAVNGTIAAWYSAPSLTTATSNLGASGYNGFVYGVGGYTTSVQATTQYARVHNGGSGVVGSWSTALTDSSLAKRNVMAVATDGYLYMMGGMNSSGTPVYYDDVYYAPLNADGSIGTWSTTTNLPANRNSAGITAWSGRIYIVGGGTGASPTLTVYSSAIGSGGTLGSWRSETSLPGYRSGAGVGAYDGRLYVAGGNTSGSVTNGIIYTTIAASDGALGGSWSTASNNFTAARQNLGFAISGGYMYIGGGTNLSSTYFSDVQFAQIQSGGDLGTWRYTAPLDTNIVGPLNVQLNVSNGFIYAMAGWNGSINSLGVLYAPIAADGSLSDWHATTAFTGRRNGGFSVAYNGYMYEGAGYNGEATYYNTVQVSSVASIARTGRYSKLVDLGNPVSISSITYNGTLVAGALAPGTPPISFRAAGSDGVFGSLMPSSAITAGATACLATSQNYKRYLLVTVTIDDAYNAWFVDASATAGNITDFTVNYITPHPEPNIRLRHGQTLQTGNLSPLDTCIP
ncbi:MAG: hypothetical protein WBP26_04325 [Candidatus Saccharimonadales bacterium]